MRVNKVLKSCGDISVLLGAFMVTVVLFTLHANKAYGQCNGAVKTYQSYSYSWDETCADMTIKADRNEFFNSGCGGPCPQRPSIGFEHDLPAYDSEWTWNTCIGATGVPAPVAFEYSFTIQSVTWDFAGSGLGECCEDYFEGIFANVGDYSTATATSMNVSLDAADNNDCGATGGNHTYTEQAGAGTNGTWEAPLPFTATGLCYNMHGSRNTVGFDVIPSFLTVDAEAAFCFGCESALNAGAIQVEFDASIAFVVCDKDFTSPYSTASPCVGAGGACGIIPMTAKSFWFDAAQKGDKIVVNWRVEEGEPVDKFNLYKSEDGVNFKHFREIDGANEPNAYVNNYITFDHDYEAAKTYYYKLEVLTEGGNKGYSDIVEVHTQGIFSNLVISPVPTKDYLNIKWVGSSTDFENLRMKLFDLTGRELLTRKLEQLSTNFSLKTLNLPDGYYLLEITDSEMHRETRSIIIEN